MSQPYNPKKARTKYACPIWVDAFLRDTLDLEADEFGAYHLLLYAMWSREACNMPDDDRKLARVSRCSMRLWKSRIRPVLEPFFEIGNGNWINTRLTKEAVKTEKFLRDQSNRKKSPDNKSDTYALPEGVHEHSQDNDNKSDKLLKNKDPVSTVDATTEGTGEHPTQETKRPSILGGGGDRRETDNLSFREQVLVAAGHPPSGVTANGKIVGGQADFAEFEKAMADLGVSQAEAISVITETSQRKRDGPATSLKYFIQPMQRFAGAKAAPAIAAITPSPTTNGGNQNERNDSKSARRKQAFIAGARGTG